MKEFTEIIEYAIQQEINAEKLYREIAEKSSQDVIKEMFLELADEENTHQQILRKILEKKHTEIHFRKTEDYALSETIEPPQISSGEVTLADVFAFAMKREEEAMNLYKKLARGATSDTIKKTFKELAAMEQGHKLKMEKAYTDMAYAEVW